MSNKPTSYLPIYLSTYRSVYLPIYCIYLTIHPSIYLTNAESFRRLPTQHFGFAAPVASQPPWRPPSCPSWAPSRRHAMCSS